MKKLFLLAPFAALTLLASCKDDEEVTPVSTTPGTVQDLTKPTVTRSTDNTTAYTEPSGTELNGEIKTNTVLKTGKTYTLKGFVYVRQGATLRIEPGTTIKGDKGTKGTLIITRNGKIDAQGTAASPIIFTSGEATPNYGDWGGIIILGNARTNGAYSGTNGLQEVEGGVNVVSSGVGLHGGTNDADNSGTMKYVRIEYPGIAFAANNEINGLTMGSVGSGTTIDYVEVYKSGDDAFEWFGGSVNAKHLIAYAATDDDFDTDNGFSGKVQYGISFRDPAYYDFASGGTSNSFESDNDAGGTTATPRTSGVFSNFTTVGAKANSATPPSAFGRGAHVRRNSAISIFNSVFVGWNTGLRIDGSATAAGFKDGTAEFENNYVVNASKVVDTAGSINSGSALDPIAFFNTGGNGNTSDAAIATASLGNVIMGSFNPTPNGGSPALSGASFSSSKLSGLDVVTYRGAVAAGGTAWYSGWSRF